MIARLTRPTWPQVRAVLAPGLLLVLVLGLWQARVFHDLFGLKTFIVPLPTDVVSAFSDQADALLAASRQTFLAALIGYVAGNTLGFLTALFLLRLPIRIGTQIGVVVASIQALPIVGIAPIISFWVTDPLWFKIVTIVIVTFPSMMIYAYRGLTSVRPDALDLMHSYGASGLQITHRVRIPGAVPQLFTALRYTSVLAVLATIVCEVLQTRDGLGYLLANTLQSFNASGAWAAVAILAIVGIVIYSLLVLLERVRFPWALRRDGA